MKKLLKLLVARKMATTPLGIAALGVGWFLGRRRKRRRAEREAQHNVPQHTSTTHEDVRAAQP
ncbi:DUF6203 family protein [Nonomuraea sp. NPDC049421]|jgi:hypothetical protein|uniref:DUF6203 family protein n=1 Tax=Nonomuraea salmonea TaxID=46181 RepID=A0ABV5NPB0_9ACTN